MKPPLPVACKAATCLPVVPVLCYLGFRPGLAGLSIHKFNNPPFYKGVGLYNSSQFLLTLQRWARGAIGPRISPRARRLYAAIAAGRQASQIAAIWR